MAAEHLSAATNSAELRQIARDSTMEPGHRLTNQSWPSPNHRGEGRGKDPEGRGGNHRNHCCSLCHTVITQTPR